MLNYTKMNYVRIQVITCILIWTLEYCFAKLINVLITEARYFKI